MTDVDPRDAQYAAALTASVVALIRATHRDDPLGMIGSLNALLGTIIEHRGTLAERPCDAALRRAVTGFRESANGV